MKKKLTAAMMTIAVTLTLALTGCGQGAGQKEASSDAANVSEAGTQENGGQDAAEAEDAAETNNAAGEENEAQGADDLLAKIQEKGEIVVAMEGTWAPWTYHDESDELVGYDVEIAKKIAEKLGVEAVFVEGEWDGLLAGLDSGRYDIMVNGVDITPERAQKYDFSEPYAYNRTAIIVSGDNEEISSMEDLNGKHTANTISSTYAEVAEQYGAQVTGVDDLNQTFELLLSGRIDATLNADADIKIALLAPEATQAAIPVRKGQESAALLEAINGALEELAQSGELSALSEKYFGVDISKAE